MEFIDVFAKFSGIFAFPLEWGGALVLGNGICHNEPNVATWGVSLLSTGIFLRYVSNASKFDYLNERIEKTEQLYEKLKKEYEKEKVDKLVKNHFGKSDYYNEGMSSRGGGGCGGCG